MAIAAETRANVYISRAIRARSRRPTGVAQSMLSSRVRASSASSTGVFRRLTTCLGPRTAAAGVISTTRPTTSQSNSMRIAGQVLFRGGRAGAPAQGFHVGGDAMRAQRLQGEPARLGPRAKRADGDGIGPAGIAVADVRGEEIDEREPGFFPAAGDEG